MANSITIPASPAGTIDSGMTESRHDSLAYEMTFEKTEHVGGTISSIVSPSHDDDNESIITLVAEEEEESKVTDEKKLDLEIEGNLVENDPRNWSPARKRIVLAYAIIPFESQIKLTLFHTIFIVIRFQLSITPYFRISSSVSSTALVGIIAGNIFFPAVDALQLDLKASQTSVARKYKFFHRSSRFSLLAIRTDRGRLAVSVSLFILGQGYVPLLPLHVTNHLISLFSVFSQFFGPRFQKSKDVKSRISAVSYFSALHQPPAPHLPTSKSSSGKFSIP